MTQLRLLLVDDSEDEQLLLEDELRQAGYDLVTCRVQTAEEMRAALDNEKFDLIICDYVIPGFSGPAAMDPVFTPARPGATADFIVPTHRISRNWWSWCIPSATVWLDFWNAKASWSGMKKTVT